MKRKLPLISVLFLFGFLVFSAPSSASASSITFAGPIEDGDLAALVTLGALDPGSALLNGRTAFSGGQPGGGNAGGESAHASGLFGAPGGVTEGLSRSGVELFSSPSFSWRNTYIPAAANSRNHKTAPAGDHARVGNTMVTETYTFTRSSVVFALSGLPDSLVTNMAEITKATSQYGADVTDPNAPASKPATMLLTGVGLIGVASFGGKKLFKK